MKSRRGFTILELVIVLAVVSALAAFSIPLYFDRGCVTLENACILLAKDLRSAQNRAAFLTDPSRLEFLSDGDGYRVMDGAGHLVDNPRTELPFVRHYSFDGVFEGVRVVEVAVGPDFAIRFDEHGVLENGGSVTLAFGEERRTILIAEGTGNMEILGSTSGWVDLGY